jgi:HEAT repeat protein
MTADEQERVRARLRTRLQQLRGRDLTDAEVAAEMTALKAAGAAAIPVLLDQFTDTDETLWAIATQALKAWEKPRPIEALLALLRSASVDDLAKALILTVLEAYGLDVDDPDLLGLGIDLGEYEVDTGRDGGNGGQNG